MNHLTAQIALIVTRSEYKLARALLAEANKLHKDTHLLSVDYIATVKSRAWTRFNEARTDLRHAVKHAENLCGIRRK